ncbi:MAG TPA: cohesin domain-containing protein [Patescibacteria group bacterium]|nr:cohesin domain-containing protein [Patescibacteria group bacterium]
MSRTFILILVLIVSVAGLLALSLNLTPKETPTPVPVSVAQTTLSLTTPSASGSAFVSNVVIDTRGNKATAVQLELSYNPQDITSVDVRPGTFFKTPDELLKKIDTANGRISYALGVGLGQKGVSGQGVIATLSFRKLRTAGITSIDFAAKSLVSAEGIAQSVLKSTLGTKFDLSTAYSSPSAR